MSVSMMRFTNGCGGGGGGPGGGGLGGGPTPPGYSGGGISQVEHDADPAVKSEHQYSHGMLLKLKAARHEDRKR